MAHSSNSSTQNKSLLVNGICLGLIAFGHLAAPDIIKFQVLGMGYFGFSGAITNWLAIHMLFERVPGLYGSGIIPLKFESFKSAIHHMMMEQFFSSENIDKFIEEESSRHLDLTPVIDKVDTDLIFEGFLDTIKSSQIGGMLAMAGGTRMIEPLRTPFGETLKSRLLQASQEPEFSDAITTYSKDNLKKDWQRKINDVVNHRLDELTPEMVKDIVQKMIRSHLGWLVLWGGVFGGIIGLVTSFGF